MLIVLKKNTSKHPPSLPALSPPLNPINTPPGHTTRGLRFISLGHIQFIPCLRHRPQASPQHLSTETDSCFSPPPRGISPDHQSHATSGQVSCQHSIPGQESSVKRRPTGRFLKQRLLVGFVYVKWARLLSQSIQ
jgi:hypothetical protein